MMNKYVFYIYAPAYTPLSSGIRVLYLLCDMLNKIGYESYVTAVYTDKEFCAPSLTPEIIKKHNNLGKLQVAIYPEIMMDNPLQSKYVIRWLLNKPNNFLKNWLGDFNEDEFIVHHDESFRPEWIKSHKQFIPHIDRSIFNSKMTAMDRSGVIIYEHRNKINEEFLSDLHGINEKYYISSRMPLTPFECAKLYKKSTALIVAERTAAHAEAGLCGCPTIFIDNEKFDSGYVFETYWKISSFKKYEKDIQIFNKDNVILLEEFYDEEVKAEEMNLKLLMDKATSFFDNIGEKSAENSKSILLQYCNDLIINKNYKDALIILERLFKFSEIPNKAYFYYYKIFLDLNNFSEANYALNYLENKILSYEGRIFFEKYFNTDNEFFV
jgi:hypothetical protein